MPRVCRRTFRVRYYECDAFGHLNNANYMRYFEEAAFDASAQVGYSVGRLREMNRAWWVRQSEIEYLDQIAYNDEVEAATWVQDFRRMTSRRAYELRRQPGGELVARGHTDWVYMDLETDSPLEIPPDMALSFFPEGLPDEFPRRQPFPAAPPPPPDVFTVCREVRWLDLDSAGHVNNVTYLDYITDAGFAVVAAYNWPAERMMEEGFAILIRRNQIQYKEPALLGDRLEISTWFSDVRRSMATRHYAVRSAANGRLLARVNSLGVWVNLKTGRPMRIPERLLADFAPNRAVGS